MNEEQKKEDFAISIRILLSLFVMIRQNYDALVYYERFLSDNSEEKIIEFIPPKEGLQIDEAIIESLWFQIILKSSSFLDEWDKFLGKNTSHDKNPKIKIIKAIVSPARKAISKWKDLKKFRNEIIAHNLRTKGKEFSLDNMGSYNCPQNQIELYYLVEFLDRMIRVLSRNFPDYTNWAIESAMEALSTPNVKFSIEQEKEFASILTEIDEKISEKIWDIVRYDLVNSIRKKS